MVRELVPLMVGILASMGFSSCMGGEGNLEVQATDQPSAIDDFSSLNVTVGMIKVHKSGGGENDTEGNESGANWLEFEVDETFDLTQLQDDNTTTLLNESLDTGRYTQIRLFVVSAEGVLAENNETVEVTVPSGTLKFVRSFEIEDGSTTTFVADLNVVKTGSGDYMLTPVIGSTHVEGPE